MREIYYWADWFRQLAERIAEGDEIPLMWTCCPSSSRRSTRTSSHSRVSASCSLATKGAGKTIQGDDYPVNLVNRMCSPLREANAED